MSEPAQQPDDQGEWITEADIVRAAKLLIELRGSGAYSRAFSRVGDLRLTGDDEAAAIWRRIAKAVERLQAEAPAEASRRPDEGANERREGASVFRGGLLRN